MRTPAGFPDNWTRVGSVKMENRADVNAQRYRLSEMQ